MVNVFDEFRRENERLQGIGRIVKAPKTTLNTVDSSFNSVNLVQCLRDFTNDVVEARAVCGERR